MGESLFVRQLKATVLRNILIKKRNKRNVAAEIFMPLYFVGILALIKLGVPDSVVPSMNATSTTSDLSSVFFAMPQSIAIAPNNDAVREFTKIFGNNISFSYFHDEAALVANYSQDSSVAAGIILSDNPAKNGSYSIYLPFDRVPDLSKKYDTTRDCLSPLTMKAQCSANFYLASGFSQLQNLIDSVLIKLHMKPAKDEVAPPKVKLKLLPQREQILNLNIMRSFVPVYTVIAFSPFVTYVVMIIVGEKEQKIREALKIMGLADSVYWLSWFIVYGAFVLFLVVMMTILFYAFGILRLSNLFLIFLGLMLYGLSIISMSFMVTPFFNKAKVAGAICSLMTALFSCLYFVAVYVKGVDSWVFWALSLLSPTALALGMDAAINSELLNVGLSFDNLWDGLFPFAGSLIMLAVDIVLYSLLAYYFDSVIPGEYGRKRLPWFCFLPTFWFPNSSRTCKPLESTVESGTNSGLEDIEPISAELLGREAIRIVNLGKTFTQRGKEDVIALNDVNFNIYKGQITALLGHNGAGKTTMINILLGMIAQTNGSVIIDGHDTSDYDVLVKVRQMVGICPQHDILFERLTPVEHLEYFANIKMIPVNEVKQVVNNIIQDVDLKGKENTESRYLSGGQKRKLCIGIALVGNPQIIVLDEPTSGVDPYSRRHLWSLFQSRKENKVILLTTHFMDEADILADRKAILTNGKIRCVGSSLFLKNRFGMGYNLTLVVEENCNVDKITTFVRSFIPNAENINSHREELIYLLPMQMLSKFPELLSAIDGVINDQSEVRLGIKSYGMSMTSLEEVFLKLGDKNDEKLADPESLPSSQMVPRRSLVEENITNDENETNGIIPFPINRQSEWQSFKAASYIRLLIDLRLPKNFFSVIVFPVIMLSMSFLVFNLQSVPEAKNILNIEPRMYFGESDSSSFLYDFKPAVSPDDASILVSGIKQHVNTKRYTQSLNNLLNDNNSTAAFLDIETYDATLKSLSVMIAYNLTDLHIMPVILNILNNARLNPFSSTVKNYLNVVVKTFPMLSLPKEVQGASIGATVMLGLTFASTPIAFAIDVIEDKERKIKHLLRMNGLSFFVYWSSFFVIHSILLAFSLVAMIVLVVIFQIDALMSAAALLCLIVCYALYIPQGLLCYYLLGFLFKKHEDAQGFISFVPVLTGFVPYIIVAILDALNPTSNMPFALHCVFSFIFPLYSPYSCFYYINKIHLVSKISKTEANASDYFGKEIIVVIVAELLNVFIYGFLLWICDFYSMNGSLKNLFRSSLSQEEVANTDAIENEDSDVRAEREKVETMDTSEMNEAAVLIKSVRKEYIEKSSKKNCFRKDESKNDEVKVVVRNLSLAVDTGEVFGLLGPNGAGKTTTLKMVVMDEIPTLGKIYVSGHDIAGASRKVFQSLGYCPQFDALWKNITLREHLECFAAVRGVPSHMIQNFVDKFICSLGIEEFAKKRADTLSGGTKRKLSYAISMIGGSRTVLLDEPSTGMDPKSKRFFWNTVLTSFRNDRGAILTTHSMEEADALCTRIGILVKGELKCIGSTQHLKNKYGSGYLLEIKLFAESSSSAAFQRLQEFVARLFPLHEVQEQFGSNIKYSIPQSSVGSLSSVFSNLELAKTDLGIAEYSFSQATIEQVFLEFAKQQDLEGQ